MGTFLFGTPCVRAEDAPVAAAQQAGAFAPEGPPAATPDSRIRIFLPTGDVFKPLVADPKQPRFFVSYRRYEYQHDIINVAAVGYGELFGITRSVDPATGDGWQIGFGGGLFAQFNLDAPSHDLVNADYTVGMPVTCRQGRGSARISLYHQSSHLGDEFLLHAKPERLELSYEALNALGSYEWASWRLYGGGETLVHKEPHDLKPLSLQAGAEYYGRSPIVGKGYPVAGMDFKSSQEHDWAVSGSVVAGMEFHGTEGNRLIRFLLEGYRGFTPHGQFYTTRISYYGVAVQLPY